MPKPKPKVTKPVLQEVKPDIDTSREQAQEAPPKQKRSKPKKKDNTTSTSYFLGIGILGTLISLWLFSEFGCWLGISQCSIELERSYRVRLAYSIVSKSIDAFKLLPQADGDNWPAPTQLRKLAGNAKDAVAFLTMNSQDTIVNYMRDEFVKEGTDLVETLYLLADKCASYTQDQHSACGEVRDLVLFLNTAYCEGDFTKIIQLTKEMFTKVRETLDETRDMRTQLDTVFAKQDRLWKTSRSLRTMAKRALDNQIVDGEIKNDKSMIYKWWYNDQLKRELANINTESEYLGFIVSLADDTVKGLKSFEEVLFDNRDQLARHQGEQEKLVAELEGHMKKHIPSSRPNREECQKYQLMTSVFLDDLKRWDELRLEFLTFK
eukprot:Phypoly_transcript_10327.p1 GENE.Phypoly_transcript_10327~~Phypoly_transcript_10327.p1  ORF type:complete len:378 (+),score=36.86 Phypoly_transcript_10327:62-1195(+)